jgi:hypothetical protein
MGYQIRRLINKQLKISDRPQKAISRVYVYMEHGKKKARDLSYHIAAKMRSMAAAYGQIIAITSGRKIAPI